jgi:hypothetical protein
MSDTILYLPFQTTSGMPFHGFKLEKEAMVKLVGNLDPNMLHNITSLLIKEMCKIFKICKIL